MSMDKKIEELAKELFEAMPRGERAIDWDSLNEDLSIYKERWKLFAKYVLRREIKARIDEQVSGPPYWKMHERVDELEQQLKGLGE